ncbi:MAG TPA: arginine deiminase family protein, partial [Pyrinomonadaceae bacterium]|nr:arginine deiminase family protein [Pyrinomonadaceae bacterium]
RRINVMLIALTNDVSPAIVNVYGEVDFELAARQQEEYGAALARAGARVERLAVNGHYPDSCFIEDTAVVVDEVAVVTNMTAEWRRGEPAAIENVLAGYRDVTRLSGAAEIDGGDVLRVGRELFVGLSSRTNQRAAEELKRILGPHGYTVTAVGVQGCLHLKTACTALDERTLLINPAWVEAEAFAGYELLAVPLDEPLAANTLSVNDTLFLQAGFPKTIELVRERHERTEVLDMSEFNKADGSLTCLSLIFEHEV